MFKTNSYLTEGEAFILLTVWTKFSFTPKKVYMMRLCTRRFSLSSSTFLISYFGPVSFLSTYILPISQNSDTFLTLCPQVPQYYFCFILSVLIKLTVCNTNFEVRDLLIGLCNGCSNGIPRPHLKDQHVP